jgi:putative hydrolase of the HAD superfamily
MIKYAIFDLDDTLLDFQRGEHEGLTKILTKYGVTNLQQGMDTYLEINRRIWDAIEQGANRTELLNTRFSKTLKLFDIEVDGAQVEAEYREHLNHNFHQLAGAEDLLKDLKGAGVQLLVGTNGVKKTQLDRLTGSGLDGYFVDCFISDDVGYPKPDRRFFTPMLTKYSDMQADNTVMIGDRLQADILGANHANLSSIWYNPKNHLNQESYRPTYEAHSFDEIKAIVLN